MQTSPVWTSTQSVVVVHVRSAAETTTFTHAVASAVPFPESAPSPPVFGLGVLEQATIAARTRGVRVRANWA
jgi:hypothetical protein